MNFCVNWTNAIRTAVLCAAVALSAWASERGSAAEAESMAKRAVAYVKANGRDKAANEFTNGASFKDRDLYVSYYDLKGVNIAHGANPKLVGKDLSGLKDPDGKPILQMIIDVAKNKGKGWTDTYKFRDPVSDKMAEKVIYVERIDDTLIGVGVYKQ